MLNLLQAMEMIITQFREFSNILLHYQFAVKQDTKIAYNTGRRDRDCVDM